MKNTKRYPFNMNKHQHDIFFRYNRTKNEYDEKCYNGTITSKEIDQYETLIDSLSNLLSYGTGIVWLTGKEFGLAQECVAWAGCSRKGVR